MRKVREEIDQEWFPVSAILLRQNRQIFCEN